MITLDVSATFASTGSSPETNAITVATGSNLLLVVHVYGSAAASPFTCTATYNGVSMTKFSTTDVTWPTQTTDTIIFYTVAPATGTHDVVVTYGGALGLYAIAATTYQGVNQSSPIEQTSSPDFDFVTSNTALTSTFNITANNAWQVTMYGTAFSPATFTATLGTLESQGGVTQKIAIIDRGPLSPPGSYSTSATVSGGANNFGAWGVSIAPVPVSDFVPQALIL